MDEYEIRAFMAHQDLLKMAHQHPRNRGVEETLKRKIIRYRNLSRTYRAPLPPKRERFIPKTGKAVRHIASGQVFESQEEAARHFGADARYVSYEVNNVPGTYKRLGLEKVR